MDPFNSSAEPAKLYLQGDRNLSGVEDFARKHGADFLVLYVRSDRVKLLAPILGFSKVNEIKQGNRQVIVYGSN
jgi:hypothetical protein